MITCPWCGTNYTTFQSDCSRCGGPMPVPTQLVDPVIGTGEAPAPLSPPAAPRTISNNYVWKLMFGEGWTIAALVFLLLGGIFSVVGFALTVVVITAFVGIPFLILGIIFLIGSCAVIYWRYQVNRKQVMVLKWGQSVLGTVSNLEENYSVTVNGRHPWSIDYQFQVGGQAYTGKVGTLNQPGIHLQTGRPVYVLYMQTDPLQNSLYPHP